MKNPKKSIDEKPQVDAVKLMRDIRDKLSARWSENPALEISDLQKIRQKYKIKMKPGKHAA